MITIEQRTPLLVLFGAIGFVLLIACVNVANLQMSRAVTRHREIAVRAALAAGRLRLLRQLLTENVLLGLLGAAGGLLVANWSLHSLLSLTPTDLPHAGHIHIDGWALGFTVLAALLASILFGMVPAVRASRPDLANPLKEAGGWASLRRHRLGSVLVSAEVALSLVLLVGSGLLIRTFANLLRTKPGIDPHNVLSVPIWTTGTQYKSGGDLARFYETALGRIEAIPGVESAAVVAAGLPLERGGNSYVEVAGDKEGFSADYREITPGCFDTLRIPLLQGRFFTADDSPAAHKVIIVNAAFAREHHQGRDPVGLHLKSGEEIVGVVGDVKSHLNEPAPPTFFVPMAQASYESDQLFQGWFPTCVLIRTAQKSLEPQASNRKCSAASRSQPAHRPGALDGRGAGAVHRIPALSDDADERFRGLGPRARCRGALWGDYLLGEPAHARDRNPHRSWRYAAGGAGHCDARRIAARADRHCRRIGRDACTDPDPQYDALRREAHRPANPSRRRADPCWHLTARQLHSGATSGESGSIGSVEE